MCWGCGVSAHEWSCLAQGGSQLPTPLPPATSAVLYPWQGPGCRHGEGWGQVCLPTEPQGGAVGTCEGLYSPCECPCAQGIMGTITNLKHHNRWGERL